MLNKNIKYLKILLLLLLLVIMGCRNIDGHSWEKEATLSRNWEKTELEIGDIIVKKRGFAITSWYGHVGIVVDKEIIGDYPQPYEDYREMHYRAWLGERRDIIILRYKGMTPEFKTALIETINHSKNQEYWITLNKGDIKKTYCSKYIWYLYNETAKKMGYNLDISDNSKLLIFPYDFLKDENLYQVYIKKAPI